MEPAQPGDVPVLLQLRDRVAESLLARGVKQWLPGEFGEDRMAAWVNDGRVFVLRQERRVAAAVAVLWSDKELWGDCSDDTEAGYVHLLMVDPDRMGQGLGGSVLRWTEEFIRASERDVVRLDAVTDNPRLHRWYAERGYTAVGEFCFENEGWFDTTLLEKRL